MQDLRRGAALGWATHRAAEGYADGYENPTGWADAAPESVRYPRHAEELTPSGRLRGRQDVGTPT